MAAYVLPFEKPIVELIAKTQELRLHAGTDPAVEGELRRLEEQTAELARELFAVLSPWQKVQLSRHPNRPYSLDHIEHLLEDFRELHGDRSFADDEAIVGGLGRFNGISVAVVAEQKGRGAKDAVRRNFGMPHPEGYRKARRIYELAERFGIPILTFIDTPGAYPGIGAEERGQSEAIGSCLAAMARATVPIICTIIGEGGSGGALALGVGNRVNVLEYGTYSVISPEGCASILWKDGSKAEEAAERLKITAEDLKRLGVVDEVIREPVGGAHQDIPRAAALIGAVIGQQLEELQKLTGAQLRAQRYDRFRRLGSYIA